MDIFHVNRKAVPPFFKISFFYFSLDFRPDGGRLRHVAIIASSWLCRERWSEPEKDGLSTPFPNPFKDPTLWTQEAEKGGVFRTLFSSIPTLKKVSSDVLSKPGCWSRWAEGRCGTGRDGGVEVRGSEDPRYDALGSFVFC
ncbi:hypothetical protein E1A91_D09G075700v1 [Gossypium mustelinum]|uniref:Uncharacterized protein n=1 Tax=Gossypium mustelinum TaxID=34275 RepID=A0A5D2TGN6_GOSMU|nr:hypothetical protein E1A91_D09G075700v1 [Gossypium mustelinum]